MRKFSEVITCDRCGHSTDVPGPKPMPPWGLIKRPGDQVDKDICPSCLEQFWAWWRAAAQ